MGGIIIFLAGEVLGDSAFFLSKYPKADIVPVREREYRYYGLMPFVSVIISIGAIGLCMGVQNILRVFYDLMTTVLPEWNWGVVRGFVIACFGVLPNVTSMWLYMYFY